MDIAIQLVAWAERLGLEWSRVLWMGAALALLAAVAVALRISEQYRRVRGDIEAQGARIANVERYLSAARAAAKVVPENDVSDEEPSINARPIEMYGTDTTSLTQLVRQVGALAEEAAEDAQTRVFEHQTRLVGGRATHQQAAKRA